MASEMVQENEESDDGKEFVVRVLSSFMFIPLIFLLFLVHRNVFLALCWTTFGVMACEILSPKIRGKWPLRALALAICFLGIVSFIHCRKFFGPLGCGFLIGIASFTDIGAYSFGKVLRGPKLCPKISPKKTWAGLMGGIILANVACFCAGYIFFRSSEYGVFWPKSAVNFWTVQAVILASVLGDLLESTFKRKIEVKDMGDVFPGHGGILDRLDSLILASIVFTVIDILF
ncbi:MAG: phosphatidate cytidylyltransferase [Holosporaceae bacterium]|jgi:phosphatidate cytidylyltransferase|nr:phosphatidate cytidylyltransferase [Holosporaceae bacterium]